MKTLVKIGALVLASCASEAALPLPQDLVGSSPVPPKEEPADAYAVSSGKSVLWKRYAALERDLMRALELGRDEVCREVGGRNCIRDVHLIALGGNDPFGSGINRPPPGTLGTTPLVIDRVLLSACSARAAADKKGGAKVFTELDLAGPVPDSSAASATITTLFRRLLARDPKPIELAQVMTLLDPNAQDAPQTAQDFAVLACFVIGSSLEFLFQ